MFSTVETVCSWSTPKKERKGLAWLIYFPQANPLIAGTPLKWANLFYFILILLTATQIYNVIYYIKFFKTLETLYPVGHLQLLLTTFWCSSFFSVVPMCWILFYPFVLCFYYDCLCWILPICPILCLMYCMIYEWVDFFLSFILSGAAMLLLLCGDMLYPDDLSVCFLSVSFMHNTEIKENDRHKSGGKDEKSESAWLKLQEIGRVV